MIGLTKQQQITITQNNYNYAGDTQPRTKIQINPISWGEY